MSFKEGSSCTKEAMFGEACGRGWYANEEMEEKRKIALHEKVVIDEEALGRLGKAHPATSAAEC